MLVLVGMLLVIGMTSVSADVTCSGSTSPPTCDPLPNSNGQSHAADRVGSLGGVVDDVYQDYRDNGGNIVSKPAGSNSTAQAIAKYGPIGTWDTSQVTNMRYVFYLKKNINPDIRKWRVDSVVDMSQMFRNTDSFNIDLSSWIVSSVTDMTVMFYDATAYTQVLCGNTWIESTATKSSMFTNAGAGAKISTEQCCNPGQHLTTTTPTTCTNCPDGKYQDEKGFKALSCKACVGGRYSIEGVAQISVNICKACEAGRYSIYGEGQTLKSDCIECSAGTYSDAGSGQTSPTVCVNCEGGRYSDSGAGQASSTVCKPCNRIGSACPPGSTSPNVCLEGEYSNETDAATCKVCDVGQYQDKQGQIQCKSCVLGKIIFDPGVVSNYHTSKKSCQTCSGSTYNDELNQGQCKTCPSGYAIGSNPRADYHDENDDCKIDEEKLICEIGQQVVDRACENCLPGFIGKEEETNKCLLCPKGFYQSEPGKAVCKLYLYCIFLFHISFPCSTFVRVVIICFCN
jgi:surface protein